MCFSRIHDTKMTCVDHDFVIICNCRKIFLEDSIPLRGDVIDAVDFVDGERASEAEEAVDFV